MRHGTGHNNGHDGPGALRARDLVRKSWEQELTNCFDSQFHPPTPALCDSLSIKSGTAVSPHSAAGRMGWNDGVKSLALCLVQYK